MPTTASPGNSNANHGIDNNADVRAHCANVDADRNAIHSADNNANARAHNRNTYSRAHCADVDADWNADELPSTSTRESG